MLVKKFLKTLATQLSQDVDDVPAAEALQESFKEAVDSLPKGKLRKALRADFDAHLDTLHRNISKKFDSRIPAPYQSDNDGNLSSELSTLDERPDVREPGSPSHGSLVHSGSLVHNGALVHKKPIFCAIGKLKPPDLSKHSDLSTVQKQRVLFSYIRCILVRYDVEDDTVLELLREVESYTEDVEENTKSKFSWRYRMDTLLRLSSLVKDSKVLLRFMRILFSEITNDVEKIVKKGKAVRARNMSEILHGYLMSCQMEKEFNVTLKEEDKKSYGDLMSSLLSYYVDLRLVHASKVPKKKTEGNRLCGLVAYWLKDFPEPLLEVVLQLEGPLEENKLVVLPLIGKSLEKPPVGNSHYLKYILVVKTMAKKFGETELYDELLKARSLSCNKDFLDWLLDICPEVHEEMPTNDKKFKGRKVTKFLLDDIDDNKVSLLLDGLRDLTEDLDTHTDIDDLQKVIDILHGKDETTGSDNIFRGEDTEKSTSDELFFIDKGPTATTSTQEETRRTGGRMEEEIPVLKTQEDLEDVIDSPSAKPFKIDLDMIGDDSDQEFFGSEIVSIQSMPKSAKKSDANKDENVKKSHVLAEDTDEAGLEESEMSENADNLNKNVDKLEKPHFKSLMPKMDGSASEVEEIFEESTEEVDVNSVASSKAVEVDTESFDITKSQLSTDMSDVFSADDQVTVVHLGTSRNIIADTSTDDGTLSDSKFEGDLDNESKSNKTRKDSKEKKKSQDDSEVDEKASHVKVKSKKKSSKASNSSIASQDPSLDESELNKTERYVDGYPYKSPYSETKSSRKSSKDEEASFTEDDKPGSSKKKKKKISAGLDDNDATVMKKVSTPTSFEEKFIAKALKKTPKKPKTETDLIKSTDKKHNDKGCSIDTENDLPKSPSSVKAGKKKSKRVSVDSEESEKNLDIEDKDGEDNLAVPDEAAEKKSGRLTPQKMFEILNGVKQMNDDNEEIGESNDDRSEKGLSEYESESCIEIASESQSDGEVKKESKIKKESAGMEEISAGEYTKFESETGTDVNESSFSVIDLVSEAEDKNKETIENSLSEGECLGKSPKQKGSKLKSPKLEHPKLVHSQQDQGEETITGQDESPTKVVKSDSETYNSPIQKSGKPVVDVMGSPRKTPVKILTPKEKPTMTVDHKDAEETDDDQTSLKSPPKTKTPPNTPVKTPRRSPRKSSCSIEENTDVDNELSSDKRRLKKSSGLVKSPDTDAEITVHKSFMDKEYTPGKMRHILKSPENEGPVTDAKNIKIPSSHKKKLHLEASTESESELENIPDIAQHLKSPLIPVMSVKIYKRVKDESEYSGKDVSESESNDERPLLRKKGSAHDRSKSDSDSKSPSLIKQGSAKKLTKIKDKTPQKEKVSESELESNKTSPSNQGSSKKHKKQFFERIRSPGSSEGSSEEQGTSKIKRKSPKDKLESDDNMEDYEASPSKVAKLNMMEEEEEEEETDLEVKTTKKSKSIFDFPSETDQLDKEEMKLKKSPKLTKITEKSPKLAKVTEKSPKLSKKAEKSPKLLKTEKSPKLSKVTEKQRSSRRRSMAAGVSADKDEVKPISKSRRAKSMGAIAEQEEASEEDVTEDSEIVSEPKKHKSPIPKKVLRQRKVKELKVPSPTKPAEKTVKEPKVGQKRKSVRLTGVEEIGSGEEVEVKKSSPPKRRSSRKSTMTTETDQAAASSKRTSLPSTSKAKTSSPTKKRYSLRNK